MMKFKVQYFLVAILFSFNISFGQVNLVRNPSFEILDTCPWTCAQLKLAEPWFQPNDPQNSGSTDLMSTCSNSIAVGLPWNFSGFQNPRTGNSLVGFATHIWHNDTIDREYLEVRLLDTLKVFKKYCVSFYVSYASLMNWHLPTSALGAYFSNDSLVYYSNNYTTIHVTPQIRNPYNNIISDTVNWVLISGILTATGGEQYMTIGNFWDPPFVNDTCVGTPCGGSYYYIDDVSVVELPEIDAGTGDTICRGDSALLIGSISEVWQGMRFEWMPHGGLDNPDNIQTNASPDSTTTYYLTVSCATCDVACMDSIADSVTVYVIQPSLSIDAGNDISIAPGDSVQLGTPAQAGLTYYWQPATGLDDPNTAQPWASPEQTTTYILTSTFREGSCDFVLHDSVHIGVSVGINELGNNKTVSIYPNPASSTITIESNNKPSGIIITDVLGKIKIKNSLCYPITTIDIGSMVSGVYFVKIINEKGISTGKFVKE